MSAIIKEVRLARKKEKLRILIKDMALTYAEKGLPFKLVVHLWTLYRVLVECIGDDERLLGRVEEAANLAMRAAESDREEERKIN